MPPEMQRRIAASGLAQRLETGSIEPRQFVSGLCDLIQAEIAYDHFCGMFNSIFTGTLVPESLLEGLAARYRLLLLSNTNAIHYRDARPKLSRCCGISITGFSPMR